MNKDQDNGWVKCSDRLPPTNASRSCLNHINISNAICRLGASQGMRPDVLTKKRANNRRYYLAHRESILAGNARKRAENVAKGLTCMGRRRRKRGATKRQLKLRRATKRWWTKRAAEFRAQGRTTRGTERKRAFFDIPLHGLARRRFRERLYIARLNARGLSSRGNPKKSPLTSLDLAWRELRAGIKTDGISWDNIEMTQDRNYAHL